jgi:hypothetical protein
MIPWAVQWKAKKLVGGRGCRRMSSRGLLEVVVVVEGNVVIR